MRSESAPVGVQRRWRCHVFPTVKLARQAVRLDVAKFDEWRRWQRFEGSPATSGGAFERCPIHALPVYPWVQSLKSQESVIAASTDGE